MMKSAVAVLFANLKSNIGDFAILHAILLDLRRKFPGRTIDVFSLGLYEIDDTRLAAFREECDVDFELAGKTYFRQIDLAASGQKILRFFLLWPKLQERLTRSLVESVSEDAMRFRDYEAIFIVGGERGGGTEGGISLFATLEAVHRHNDKIYTFPFSVSPNILNFNTKNFLRRSFSRIQKPLLVRDSGSKKFLNSIGVDSVLGADCVFSLQSLAEEVEGKVGQDSSRIIFSFAVRREKIAKELIETLKGLAGSAFKISLMTTCEIEDGRRLKAISRDFGLEYLAPITWEKAVAELKSSSLLVTNRLHGMILGSLAGAPLLVVTNREKAKSFVEDAQLPLSAQRIFDVTEDLLAKSLAQRQVLLDSVKTYLDRAGDRLRSPLDYDPISTSMKDGVST